MTGPFTCKKEYDRSSTLKNKICDIIGNKTVHKGPHDVDVNNWPLYINE